jgi:3-mercaptopyruvate sulfurtransferase SseA
MSKQQTRSASLPILLMVIGVFLIVGAGAWYLFVLPAGSGESIPPSSVVEDNYSQIPRLSTEEAKAAYDMGTAIFVDVRDAESYSRGHIQGALSIPFEDLPARVGELDPSTWIITY